jgi:LysM repeat protein
MTDAEYKAKQAETKSKIKVLQSNKNRTPEQTKQLKKLQVFRTSLSPSKKAQVKKNIGTATDIALTGLTLVPGLGALGLGARAIMKGVQAGKTLYKVGSRTFKSKDAAVAAAKKIKAPLPPRATGNLSTQARGMERITRKGVQTAKTPSVRGAATRGITKTAAEKAALKTSAKRSAAGAATLGTISALAATAKEKKKDDSQKTVKFEGRKVPLIKAHKEPFKVKPKLTHTPKKSAPKIAPAPSFAAPSKSYTVKGGDTLSDIAEANGTTLKALLKANPNIDKPNEIRVGQKIKLSKPVRGRKSVYQGMSKSAMAKIHKGPSPPKYPSKLRKHTGGRLGRMGGAGLSPAEMARAGVMSEAQRRREAGRGLYARKGGKVGKKKGGTVNRKHGGQIGTAFVAEQYAPRKR